MDQPHEWDPRTTPFLMADRAFGAQSAHDFDEDRDEDRNEDLDEDLDEEFPLGDGVADRESVVSCPYCGESVEITLDPGSGSHQSSVEDCSVCCRPWNVSVAYHDDGSADVFVDASDDQ